jgi:hypothetical protein
MRNLASSFVSNTPLVKILLGLVCNTAFKEIESNVVLDFCQSGIYYYYIKIIILIMFLTAIFYNNHGSSNH